MIVPTMTLEEIIKEHRKDSNNIETKYKAFSEKFGSLCKKTYRFPFTKVYKYKTLRGNDVLYIFRAYKRSDWKNPKIQALSIYSRAEGRYALMHGTIRDFAIVMPPHFFSRYRERILKDTTISTEELIATFFLNNHRICLGALPEHMRQEGVEGEENKFDVGGKIDEGCIFGSFQKNGIILIKTVIRDDMLYDNQKEFFSRLERSMARYADAKLDDNVELIPVY